jgi:hypothetical protein
VPQGRGHALPAATKIVACLLKAGGFCARHGARSGSITAFDENTDIHPLPIARVREVHLPVGSVRFQNLSGNLRTERSRLDDTGAVIIAY